MSKATKKSPVKKAATKTTTPVKKAVAKKAATKSTADETASKREQSNTSGASATKATAKKATTKKSVAKQEPTNILHVCTERPAPITKGATAAELTVVTDTKWAKGTTITISFMDGSAKQKALVQQMAAKWLPFISLKFSYVPTGGMIRISFIADAGSWSYLGRQCLSIPKSKPTMNFGWLRDNSTLTEWERVVVHEFGHALGCTHEHQNPSGGINWNKPAVYKYYQGPPNNWTKEQVDNNLFKKYAANQTQFTKLDPKSIMMYPIPKEFLLSGEAVGWNTHLSDTDKDFITKTYK